MSTIVNSQDKRMLDWIQKNRTLPTPTRYHGLLNSNGKSSPVPIDVTGKSEPIFLGDINSTISLIKAIVATYYDVDPNLAYYSRSRLRELVLTRQMYCFIMLANTMASLSEIGRGINGRDHATIIYAKSQILNLLDTTSDIRHDAVAIQRIYEEHQRGNQGVDTTKRLIKMNDFLSAQSEKGDIAALISGATIEQAEQICSILKIPKESIVKHEKSPFYIYRP